MPQTSPRVSPDARYGEVTGKPLRLVVLGDSIGRGIGCTRAEETLGARLAVGLAGQGVPVDLRVLAVPGARSADLLAQVPPALAHAPDLAVVVIGANDLPALTPPPEAAASLGVAVARLRRAGAQVVVATAPDLSVLPGVPPSSRHLVAWASRALAQAQAAAVQAAGGTVAPLGDRLAPAFAADPGLLSADRFHPSPRGYALIAEGLLPYVRRAAGAAAAVGDDDAAA